MAASAPNSPGPIATPSVPSKPPVQETQRVLLPVEFLRAVDAATESAVQVDTTAIIEPRFSFPVDIRTNISSTIVKAIDTAQGEILINTYAITDIDVAQAIIRARLVNGLRVVVILEPAPSVRNYRVPAYLIENNIPVFYDSAEGFNNNAYVIINREIVITGSYQLTQSSANQNAENIIFIRHKPTAMRYYRAFAHHLGSCAIPAMQLAKNPNTVKDVLSLLAP